MKKLEGFTIIELTIALAVSAVTVGIAMYTLNYVSIVSKKRSLANDQAIKLAQAEALLHRDGLHAENITLEDSVFYFVRREDTIRYDFKQHILVRKSRFRQDTLLNKILNMKWLKEKYLIKSILISAGGRDENGYILYFSKNYPLFLRKQTKLGNDS